MATYSDSFTRADAANLGTDYGTLTGQSAIRVVSNQAAGPAASTEGTQYVLSSVVAFAANQSAQATVSGMSSGSDYVGVGVRMNGGDGYVFISDGVSGAGHTEIGKWVGGSYTALIGVATTVANGDVLKLAVSGSSPAALTAYKNGASVGTFNDSTSPIASGQPGMDSFGVAPRMDDFSATDATSGPTITSTDTATPNHTGSLTITGTAFGASQGAGSVTIGGVAQSVTAWADTSITVTVDRGTNKYGAALNVVVTDNTAASSSPYALTGLLPQTGWDYVDVVTPSTTAANRITASPDIATGDQIAWDTVGGRVQVYNDCTFSAVAGTSSFEAEVWTTGSGWGASATQWVKNTVADTRQRKRHVRPVGARWMSQGVAGEKFTQRGWFSRDIVLPIAAGGGSSAAVGTGSEADSALPLGSARLAGVAVETDSALARGSARPAGVCTESETALALVPLQIGAAGLATEANSALAAAGVQQRATGLASEADTALALARLSIGTAGLAAESDQALALVPGANGAAGLAIETDTARSLGVARPTGLASESDTALGLAAVSIRGIGLTSATDSALPLVPLQLRAVGLAIEADTALGLSSTGGAAVGLANEADTSLACGAARPAGVAPETGAALALVPVQIRAAGVALETDSAIALTGSAGTSAGLSTEADTAIARGAARSLGLVSETDAAFGLAATLIRQAGQAAESDVAFALAGLQRRGIGLAVEADSALQLFRPGALPVGVAVETDTALAILAAITPTWPGGGTARLGGSSLAGGGDRLGGSPLTSRNRRIG